MFTLRSDRLRLEIMHPGEAPNDTCRFDWAGCISEIVLDGEHRFGASEPNNLVHPSSGGRGITNEIQCDLSAEAPENGRYPKFGVGLIKKIGNEPWVFYNRGKYDIQPFDIELEIGESEACFITHPRPCMGYALRQIKRIWVEGNRLSMRVRVENVGEKPIVGREYCHNFLTIDSMALGPAYTVELHNVSDRGTGMLGKMIRGNGRGYTFDHFQKEAELAYLDLADIDMDDCFEWTMRNTDARASIHVRDYVRPCYFQMWAVDHIISVEVFRGLDLKPGDAEEWLRTWEFDGE